MAMFLMKSQCTEDAGHSFTETKLVRRAVPEGLQGGRDVGHLEIQLRTTASLAHGDAVCRPSKVQLEVCPRRHTSGSHHKLPLVLGQV